jgi:hypothetical protein
LWNTWLLAVLESVFQEAQMSKPETTQGCAICGEVHGCSHTYDEYTGLTAKEAASKTPPRWSDFHRKILELQYGAETQDREELDELEKIHLELLKAMQDNFNEAIKKHGLLLMVDPNGTFSVEVGHD